MSDTVLGYALNVCSLCLCIAHITHDTRMISSRHYLLRVVKSGVKCLKEKKIKTDIYVGNQKLFAMHLLAYTLYVAGVWHEHEWRGCGRWRDDDDDDERIQWKNFSWFKTKSVESVFMCTVITELRVGMAFRKWMCTLFVRTLKATSAKEIDGP